MKKRHKIPPPKSLDAAFAQIEGGEIDPPTKAIEYLRKHPTDERIIEKIIYYFENAYAEDENGMWSSAPLWYSFVAEKHLDIRLIDAVISIYKTDEDTGDFFAEQGSYLTGALCEKFGDHAVSKFADYVDSEVAGKSERDYLFLLDFMYYADVDKYKERFLNYLKQKPFWLDSFVMQVAHLQIKEAIPIIKKLMAEMPEDDPGYTWVELEEALKELQTGVCEYPDVSVPWFERREDWKRQYKQLFEISVSSKKTSLGRNDPCYCGSGKKYKKCHMKQA